RRTLPRPGPPGGVPRRTTPTESRRAAYPGPLRRPGQQLGDPGQDQVHPYPGVGAATELVQGDHPVSTAEPHRRPGGPAVGVAVVAHARVPAVSVLTRVRHLAVAAPVPVTAQRHPGRQAARVLRDVDLLAAG